MGYQPPVHHVSGGLTYEVVLHELWILVQPGLHPSELGIVPGAGPGASGTRPSRIASAATAAAQVMHMLVKMVMVVQVVVIAELVMIQARNTVLRGL